MYNVINLMNIEKAVNNAIINAVENETIEKVKAITEKGKKAIMEMSRTKKMILDNEIYMYLYELVSYDNLYILGCFCSGLTEKGGYRRTEKTLKIVVLTANELLANTSIFFSPLDNSSENDFKRGGKKKTIKLKKSGFRQYMEKNGFELVDSQGNAFTESRFETERKKTGLKKGYYLEKLLTDCTGGKTNQKSNEKFSSGSDIEINGRGFQVKMFLAKMSTFNVIENELIDKEILPDDLI